MLTKFTIILSLLIFMSCNKGSETMTQKKFNIIFLHHSTGQGVWKGSPNKLMYKIDKKGAVEKMFDTINKQNKTKYIIKEQVFPKQQPYGWNNYPFDYYNIWVKNAGQEPFMGEPTLEILSKDYNMIIFKHCFPISGIQSDSDSANINSNQKTLANYKLQYEAIKQKLHEFPDVKFLLWTGAALVESNTTPEEAERATIFADWIKNTWNEEEDNIYLWDFRALEVENGIYLKNEYAHSPDDSHPNAVFNGKAAKLFVNRIIDVIENKGIKTTLTGVEK